MTKSEGTIKEFYPDLYKKKQFVACPYCSSCILPGYSNIVKHWVECPKNPQFVKSLELKTPLIDEIKKNIKF
ncbi:MAG: hypothetical protein ACJ749_17595 [Flavisolibacter sp.]